jgi:hypothetical protein
MTKVKMQLVGMDGNAISILGSFSREARKQGWTQPEIKKVLDEATSKDYDHLLTTIVSNVDMGEEDDNWLDDEGICDFCGECGCEGECEDEE